MIESQLPSLADPENRLQTYPPSVLIILVVITLLLSLGLAGVAYGAMGPSGTVLLMSATLIIGVLWSYGSLFKGFGIGSHIATTDQDLLKELVGLNRRATILTDLRGRTIIKNDAYDRLCGGQEQGLDELVASEGSYRTMARLLNTIRRQGSGEAKFVGALEDKRAVTLRGRRVSRYILWEVRGEGASARIQQEIDFIERWAQPFLETLDSGVSVEDEKGRLRYVNSVLGKWLALEKGAPLPERVELAENGRVLVTPDGNRIEIESTFVPLKTRDDDHFIGQVRFLRSLARMRISRVGQTRTGLIDPIFEAAPLAIAIVEPGGQLKEFNRTFQRIVERSQVKNTGNVAGLVGEGEGTTLLSLIKEVHSGLPPSGPLAVQLRGPGQRVGQICFSTIQDGDNRYVVLYLQDTTQEHRLEQQFVQAQKLQAVGQLAGGIAHDFNNLLTAIIGFCDLLLIRHDTRDQSFSDLIQIKQNANRAANLVRQLLAFSRQQTMRPKILTVSDVLADLMHLIRRLIGEKIELKVTHGRDLPNIKADQGQIEQVFINLAVNARDAMQAGGTLELITSQVREGDRVFDEFDLLTPGHYVLIEVKDTGVGIPAENFEKIFEPFFTTKEVGQGTGLGLATVYGIVKQTGGYVFCRSVEGEGTSFLVFLKAYEEEEAEEDIQIQENARDLTGTGTILLVEDEDPVRMFAERALSTKGYKVVDAASGEQALEYVESADEPISLLITDVVMPEMDGPALVDIIRKDRDDLPVIFISGYAEDMLRKDLEDPKNHFLPKPFSLKALAELVKEVIGT